MNTSSSSFISSQNTHSKVNLKNHNSTRQNQSTSKPTTLTKPLAPASARRTIKDQCIPLHSFPQNSVAQNSTTRYTTRNLWLLSWLVKNGDNTSKERLIPLQFTQTTRT